MSNPPGRTATSVSPPPVNDGWLASLVCPISAVRVRQDVVRQTALLAALPELFVLLEALGNSCVGCLVYSYVVTPIVRRQGAL